MVDPSTPGESPSDVAPCWSCKGPVDGRALFCSTCGAVQAPRPVDHFARLVLEPGFDLDQGRLERQYFGLQRRLHPDRFAARSARERAISTRQSVSVNDAYETLKDPLRRAEYMLERAGVSIGNGAEDPAMLAEAMADREALAAADTAEEVTAFTADAAARSLACLSELSESFAAGCFTRAARAVLRLRYLAKFAEAARRRHAELGGKE